MRTCWFGVSPRPTTYSSLRWYSGKIPAHNNREGDEYVRVEYDDGDGESIHISEISEFLLEEEEEE